MLGVPELDHLARLDVDQVVVVAVVGGLVARPAAAEVAALQDAPLLQQAHRPVDRGDGDAPVEQRGAAVELLHVRVVAGLRQHARDDAPLLGHLQPALHAPPLHPAAPGRRARGRLRFGARIRCAGAAGGPRRNRRAPGNQGCPGHLALLSHVAQPAPRSWAEIGALRRGPQPPQPTTGTPRCLALCSGSTWMWITAWPARSRRARSMRSQIACASPTVMRPGTTRWNSTKVTLPAVRVRTSCASMAPSACSEMTCRSSATACGSATSSISPPT